jgi:hypothetical protein
MLEISGHGGRLRLTPLARPRTDAASPWDRDALKARVELDAGAVAAAYETTVWGHELAGLRALLASLHEQVRSMQAGRLRYVHRLIEGTLRLELELGPRGDVGIDVEARPNADGVTLLRTRIEADQSYVPAWIAALDAMLAAYPPLLAVDGPSDTLAAREDAILESDTDAVVEIDVGCVPEAAISGPVLLQSDRRAILTFNAMRVRADGMREDAGTAVVELRDCVCTQFGYPNDEALPGHPLYRRGLGAHGYAVYEVLRSSWVRRLEAQNRVCFPNTGTWRARHFVVAMHDSTFECIAGDLALRVVAAPSDDLFVGLLDRVLSDAP